MTSETSGRYDVVDVVQLPEWQTTVVVSIGFMEVIVAEGAFEAIDSEAWLTAEDVAA